MNPSVRIFELCRDQGYASRLHVLAIQVADELGDTARLAAFEAALPPGIVMAVTSHPTIRDKLVAIADDAWQPETAHLSIDDDTLKAALKARWPYFAAPVALVEPYTPPALPPAILGTGS